MKRAFTLLMLFGFLTQLSAQRLESAELVQSLTSADISALVGGALPIPFDVDLYKVRYLTPDTEGVDHVASGLLAVPLDETVGFPMACFQHGTVGGRDDVPSNLRGGHTLGVIFAGLGYVVVQPDYVGLGDSPGIHPYVHASTEASAGVDLLRATRELSAGDDIPPFGLNGQLFLSGYSQGGHAAMALHREIETNLSSEFTVTAGAHMSGPYSISEKMRDFTMGDDEYGTVAYLAWLTLGYQRAYPSTVGQITLEEVFKPAYLDDINAFKNEEIDLWELNDRITTTLLADVGTVTPKDMMNPDILNAVLTDPTHPFSMALADNDTYDWAPVAPTNLYYCEGDDQVTFENATLADEVMKANGSTTVNAIRRDTPPVFFDHGQCVSPSSQAAIFFFGLYQELSMLSEVVDFDPNVQVYYSDSYLSVKVPLEREGAFDQMSIYSSTGELVLQKNIDKGISYHEIDWMTDGMYVVTLRTDTQLYKTQKIIKF